MSVSSCFYSACQYQVISIKQLPAWAISSCQLSSLLNYCDKELSYVTGLLMFLLLFSPLILIPHTEILYDCKTSWAFLAHFAFYRSTKTWYSFFFFSLNFSCNCLIIKFASVVDLPGQKVDVLEKRRCPGQKKMSQQKGEVLGMTINCIQLQGSDWGLSEWSYPLISHCSQVHCDPEW